MGVKAAAGSAMATHGLSGEGDWRIDDRLREREPRDRAAAAFPDLLLGAQNGRAQPRPGAWVAAAGDKKTLTSSGEQSSAGFRLTPDGVRCQTRSWQHKRPSSVTPSLCCARAW